MRGWVRGWVPGWVRGWEMHNSEFACTVAAFDLNSQTVCPTVRWPCPSVYFRRRSGCVSKLGKRSTLLVVGRPSSAVRKTSTYRPRGGRFPDLKLAMSGNRPPIVRQPSTWRTTSGRCFRPASEEQPGAETSATSISAPAYTHHALPLFLPPLTRKPQLTPLKLPVGIIVHVINRSAHR